MPKTKPKTIKLTEKEAEVCLRIIRSSGWHRRRELGDSMKDSPIIAEVSHVIKKLEDGLDKG